MLHVFLTILKIIGILLAVVLGLIVLLVLCMLFWPVSYKIKGSYKDEFKLLIKAGFLGPLVRFRLQYEDGVNYKLRIMGFPFLSSEKSSGDRKKAKKRKRQSEPEKQKKQENQSEPEKQKKNTDTDSKSKERHPKSETGQVHSLQKKEEAENLEAGNLKAENLKAENISKGNVLKRKSLKEVLKHIVDKIKGVVCSVVQGIKSFFQLLSSVKELLEDEKVRFGCGKARDEVFLFLKKMRPRMFRCSIKMGFEDPSLTGKLLGAFAVLRGMWNCNLSVEPDFEHSVLEADFEAKGFFQGFRFVRVGWKLMFDKDIKYVWKSVQNIRRK